MLVVKERKAVAIVRLGPLMVRRIPACLFGADSVLQHHFHCDRRERLLMNIGLSHFRGYTSINKSRTAFIEF